MLRHLPKAAAAVCLTAVTAFAGPAILPLDEIEPGMVGTGVTVFEGGRLDEFQAEILGVLENTSPGRNTILATLSGGPLAESGVIAGMSGSPVYVDGKLLGAVSSGYLFSKRPIAGITPIEEMLSIPSRDWGADSRPLYRTAAPEELQARLVAIERGEIEGPAASFAARAPGLHPAAMALTPVVVSGVEPRVYERAAALFGRFGLKPMQGAGVARSRKPATTPAELAPGSPVAIELIRGDLNIAAFGTVTNRDGDDVLAFGHPLFNVGTVRFPLAASDVVTVLPSVYSSFKISSMGPTLGALVQDRSTGVLGKLGAEAPMIPVRLGLQRGDNPLDEFSFELATHRLLSPVLVELSLLNSLLATEKLIGAQTVSLRGRIAVDGYPEVELDHFFSGDQAASSMAGMIAAILQALLDNPFEAAPVRDLELEVDYLEDNRYALLDRVGVASTRVRPGEEIEVKAFLRRVREGDDVITSRIRVPEGTPPGPCDLIVGDAAALGQFEARSERYVPQSLGQLIELINDLRKASSVYTLLSRADAGVAVNGAKLRRLPPSAYSLLVDPRAGDTLLPIRRSTIREVETPSSYQLSGFRMVKLEVLGAHE